MVELRVVKVRGESYLVREIHAAWSAAAQQIQWKGFKDEMYVSAGDAQHSIADRRKAAVKAGFAYRTVLG